MVNASVKHSEPQNNYMKKSLLHTFSLFAALATVFLFTANTAEARGQSHRTTKYVSHYTSCGCPVYKTKVFRGHARCGKPVYNYYTQPVRHRCNRHNNYNSSRSYNSSNRCGTDNRSYYRSSRGYTSKNHRNYRNRSHNSSRSGIRVTYRR